MENGHSKSEKEELNGLCNGDGEKALLEEKEKEAQPVMLENSYYCMWTLFLSVSSVMMSVGISVGAMNASLSILANFYNQTYMERYDEPISKETSDLLIALSVSMLLAGGIVGALSIGFILSKFNRKNSMIIMNGTNVVAVAILVLGGRLIPSYEAIIIGRFVMGLFAGFGMNLIPIVVAETSNRKRQAFYLSLIGVNLSFGGLLGLCLGFKPLFGTEELWPVLLTASALPSLAYLVMARWLPESPSYLLRSGKDTIALKTLRKLREDTREEALHQELAQIKREQQAFGNIKQVPLMEMLGSRPYRRQLFAVVMVFLQAQLCGVNGVGMYTNMIFISAGFTQDKATLSSTIVYSVQFVVAVAGSGAVDRWGPKMINVMSGSVMSLSLVFLTVALCTRTIVPSMAYISVAAVTIYVLAWACGINLTLFPLLGALTTEQTREAAFKFGGGIFWVFSWFVGFITPYFMIYLKNFAFAPWAFFNAFFAIYVAICLPDPKGLTPEEIQAHIQGRRGRNSTTAF